MSRRATVRWAVLVAALTGLAAGPAARAEAGPPAAPAVAAEGRAQILVMLRAPAQHYRPNSDYSGDYGDGAGRGARLRIARRIARDYGVEVLSEWPMPLLGVDCFVMAVPVGQSPEAVAARLSHEPAVSWSEPMHLYRGQAAPPPTAASHNDPLYRAQPAAAEWRLAELHQISTGRKVRVAVIDSAVERNHPDLAGQVEMAENFVPGRPDTPEAHGTGVAGVIAARADNGLGIAGMAPGARLMALRACWQESAAGDPANPATICDSLSLAKALDFAIAHRAQVINMSLAGPPDLLLGRLVDEALARGAVVVGAVDRSQRGGGFPASHPGVVAVVDEAGGPVPGAIAAPGRDIPTTQPGGRWFLVNGSSYAAAHVSGLFALMRERTASARGAAALVAARPGDGVDACATLLRVSGPCNCSCSAPRQFLAAAAK